ncbi:MAG: hypothetical protein EBR82_26455 [Caulobacteraceae bacterium]|nr:hypothetical protein [Caulobacteraceae bacterium]
MVESTDDGRSSQGATVKLDDITLTRAIQDGMLKLDAHRKVRAFVCAQLAGPWYGNDLSLQTNRTDKMPVNVLGEMVYAYLAQMVGNSVTSKVTPRSFFLRGEARMRQYMLDDLAREIDLARTLRLATLDALTGGIGIVRVGNRSGRELCHIEGKNYDIGQIYAARVDLDDYCRDPMSRDESEDRWRAYRFRASRSAMLQLYPEAAELIMAAPLVRDLLSDAYSSGLDELGGDTTGQDETGDEIELWEWFGYERGVVLHTTLAGAVDSLKALRPVAEYEGYENGPIHLLSFRHIPNNAQPLAICQQLLDMHLAMSNTSAKMVDQILSAKTAYVTRADGEQTAREMMDATDRTVFIGDPTAVMPIEIGGGMQKLYPGFDWMRAEANNASGAASMIAGQSDVSKTATGATFIANQANIRLTDMKGSVQKFTGDILSHCAWYHDMHPALRMGFSHKLPSGVGTVDVLYDSDAKEGTWTEFMFESVPVTQSAIDPNIRLARIGQLMQVGPAFLQFVAGMGGNVQAATQEIGEIFDWPAFGEFFPTQDSMMNAQILAQTTPRGAGQLPQQKQAAPSPTGGPINQVRSDMAATVPGQTSM